MFCSSASVIRPWMVRTRAALLLPARLRHLQPARRLALQRKLGNQLRLREHRRQDLQGAELGYRRPRQKRRPSLPLQILKRPFPAPASLSNGSRNSRPLRRIPFRLSGQIIPPISSHQMPRSFRPTFFCSQAPGRLTISHKSSKQSCRLNRFCAEFLLAPKLNTTSLI